MLARRRAILALQLLFVAATLAYAGLYLARQWSEAEPHARLADLRVAPIVLATLIVFATYALLVQLWRVVLVRWNARLSFVDAARIWSISNLGRFVPGRVAQIGAMAYLSRERGVSAVAATGSALLNTLVNIAAGVAIALATGGRMLDEYREGTSGIAAALVVAACAGLVALPWLLPRAVRLAARLFRRELPTPPGMPPSAVWLTAAGNVVAWLLYGLAFRLFTAGVLGGAAGALSLYIAVYTGSYIVGYLAFFTPGGLVAREAALVAFMTALGMATLPQATLVAVASRLWLTVLEVVPGLLFLAHGTLRRRTPINPGDAPT